MRDAVSSTVDLLLTPHGGPEHLFRIGPVTVDGDVVRLSMTTGEWLRDGGSGSAAGALGVLLDDLLGQAVIVHRPDGSWAVTTELAIDVCGPLPADGSRLEAEARLVSRDDAGGLSRGAVRAADGTVVAVGTTWSHFVAGVPESVYAGSYGPPPSDRTAGSLAEMLGVVGEVLPDRAELLNPRGFVHGGVLACVTEMIARRAVPGLATASLRVAYVRPAVAPVVLTPTIRHGGRSFAVVDVEARGADDRICAIATVGLRPAGRE